MFPENQFRRMANMKASKLERRMIGDLVSEMTSGVPIIPVATSTMKEALEMA
jgi:hypothetical protein